MAYAEGKEKDENCTELFKTVCAIFSQGYYFRIIICSVRTDKFSQSHIWIVKAMNGWLYIN